MSFTCNDCEKRHPGCHDKCEKYLAEKKAHEENMEVKRKEKNLAHGLYVQRRDGVEKAIKRGKHAKRYF